MWANTEWASNHIKKHGVTVKEAWEAAFESSEKNYFFREEYEPRYPPFARYWTIGLTNKGLKLYVAWEQHREVKNLITCFPASKERVIAYEKKIKKARY